MIIVYCRNSLRVISFERCSRNWDKSKNSLFANPQLLIITKPTIPYSNKSCNYVLCCYKKLKVRDSKDDNDKMLLKRLFNLSVCVMPELIWKELKSYIKIVKNFRYLKLKVNWVRLWSEGNPSANLPSSSSEQSLLFMK